MKIGSTICLLLFVAGALLALAQLWFSPLSGEMFVKVLITLGVCFVVTLCITLVRKEYLEEKELKKNDYID